MRPGGHAEIADHDADYTGSNDGNGLWYSSHGSSFGEQRGDGSSDPSPARLRVDAVMQPAVGGRLLEWEDVVVRQPVRVHVVGDEVERRERRTARDGGE